MYFTFQGVPGDSVFSVEEFCPQGGGSPSEYSAVCCNAIWFRPREAAVCGSALLISKISVICWIFDVENYRTSCLGHTVCGIMCSRWISVKTVEIWLLQFISWSMRYALWHRMHLKTVYLPLKCAPYFCYFGGSQMNNGTSSFVIPYDAEGNGSLYSVKRQEMSHSITCLGMREGRKTLNEPMREGFICWETAFDASFLAVSNRNF
jgi:hypothetical protein